MSVKIQLDKNEFKDLIDYCQLNNLNIEELSKKCFRQGLNIEKYGLLNSEQNEKPIEIIKEVIKEIPVEIVREIIVEKPIEIIKEIQGPTVEVEVIKYVDREVIKEVFIEKDVSNNDNFYDKKYVDELERKIHELENKSQEIREIIIEKPDTETVQKYKLLQQTLMKLKQENNEKNEKITQLEFKIKELEKFAETNKAVYLKGSDLNKLY